MATTRVVLHGTLIDGTGTPPLADSAVVVRGDRARLGRPPEQVLEIL